MSLEVVASFVCDGCGTQLVSSVEHRATYAKSVVFELKRIAKKRKWTTVNRGRYHTPTHWCPKCSDKPMKPVSRKQTQED